MYGLGTEGARKLVAYLPALAVGLTLIFDKWAWKWPGLRSIFHRPRLEGTWWGTLRPSKDSHVPEGGNTGPIDVGLVVEQSFFAIHVTLYTGESMSSSTAAAFRRAGESSERSVLAYVYTNEPRQESQPRSMPHGGASELQIVGLAPDKIAGRYWTNRLTAGDMEFELIARKTQACDLSTIRRERAKQKRLRPSE